MIKMPLKHCSIFKMSIDYLRTAPDQGEARERKSEPWWSVILAGASVHGQRAWRNVVYAGQLWDFGSTAVQSGGSHGVALLSHRRDPLPPCVCDSFQHVRPSCTCTVHPRVYMRARGNRDNGKKSVSHFVREQVNLLFVNPFEIEDRRNRMLPPEK